MRDGKNKDKRNERRIGMITCICLIWVGLRLNAPAWYFVLLCFGILIKILDLGIKLGKSSKDKKSY